MAFSDTLKLQVLMNMADQMSGPARKIEKSTGQTFKRIKELNQELKKLGATEQDVGKFRDIKRGLPETSREARKARNRLRELEQQMASTAEPSRKLARATNAARKASDKATEKFRAQVNQVRALRERMAAAGISTRNLRDDEAGLRRRIDKTNESLLTQKERLGAVQRKQKRLNQLRGRFHTSQQNAANLSIGGFAAVTAGRGLLSPLVAAMKQGAQFQSNLRDQAITGDLTSAQEQALGKAVRAQARRWGVATGEIFKATGSLVSAGITDPAKLKQSAQLLTKVKVATNAEMEDLGNLAVSLRQNLGINKDMAATLDALDYAGKAGKFELKDMAKWMPKLGAAMQGMGGQGKRAAASLAAAMQVARMGAGTSDEAGNNLQNFLKKITAPVTRANFKKAGIDYEARQKAFARQGIGPIEGSLKLIQEVLAKRSPAAAKALMAAANSKSGTERAQNLQRVQQLSKSFGLGELFNDQQAMAAILPLLAHMDEFKKIRDQSLQASGTVDQDAAKRMQTLTRTWDKAKTNALDLSQTVSNILAPSVAKLLKWATRLADRLGQWAKKHPKLAAGIVKVAAVAGALLAVLGGLAIAVAAVLSPFALLRFSFGKLTLMMSGTRKGLALSGKGFKRISGLAKWLGGSLKRMGAHVGRLAKLLGGGLWRGLGKAAGMVGRFGHMLSGAGLRGLLAVAKGIRVMGRALAWVGRAMLTNPILLIIAAIALAAYLVYKNWDKIKPRLVAIWNTIKDVAAKVWNAIKEAIAAVIDWISDKIDWIKNKWDKFKGLVSDIGKANKEIVHAGVQMASNPHASTGRRATGAALLGAMLLVNPVGTSMALAAPGQQVSSAMSQTARQTPVKGQTGSVVHHHGPSTTTVTVHAAPGMDAQQVGQEVRRQLDERDHQQAARKRSKLGDLE